MSIGEVIPWTKDVAAGRATHEAAVTARLDRLEEALREGSAAGFEALESTPVGGVARAAGAILVWLTRPWALGPARAPKG